MKTPDEIKKGLFCCWEDGCATCPYDDDCTMGENFMDVAKDAHAYIQQLETRLAGACGVCAYNFTGDKSCLAHIKQLESRLAQVERERDAAVNDVHSLCATNYFSGDYCEYCKYREPDGQCFHDCTPYSSEWGWKWRGVCEENTKEE